MVATAIEMAEPARETVHAIDDTRHPAVRRVADVLRARSGRPRVFLIDDTENIEQALACGIALDSLYVTGAAIDGGLPAPIGVGPDVPLHVLDETVARTLFGERRSARVFALAHAPRPPRLRDLAGAAGDVVVLDGVRIVGNIGAITRTACALGAAGVVLLDSGLRTTLDRRLVRASRGLVFATPVVLARRAECIDFIRQERLTVAALSADAAAPLSTIRRVEERLALVLGGERDGVSPDLAAVATRHYAIPMTPRAESLNVSVAAGIALYERGLG